VPLLSLLLEQWFEHAWTRGALGGVAISAGAWLGSRVFQRRTGPASNTASSALINAVAIPLGGLLLVYGQMLLAYTLAMSIIDGSHVAAIYAERFDSYSGERLQVTGERASPGGTIITSQIIKSNGEPVNVNYLMRNNGGVWQIADIYLDGTISELATRRSEFASILRTGGINGLIQALNTKASALAARAS